MQSPTRFLPGARLLKEGDGPRAPRSSPGRRSDPPPPPVDPSPLARAARHVGLPRRITSAVQLARVPCFLLPSLLAALTNTHRAASESGPPLAARPTFHVPTLCQPVRGVTA